MADRQPQRTHTHMRAVAVACTPDLEAERGTKQLTRDSKKRCRNPKLTPDMAPTGIAAVSRTEAVAGDETDAEAAVERLLLPRSGHAGNCN